MLGFDEEKSVKQSKSGIHDGSDIIVFEESAARENFKAEFSLSGFGQEPPLKIVDFLVAF